MLKGAGWKPREPRNSWLKTQAEVPLGSTRLPANLRAAPSHLRQTAASLARRLLAHLQAEQAGHLLQHRQGVVVTLLFEAGDEGLRHLLRLLRGGTPLLLG